MTSSKEELLESIFVAAGLITAAIGWFTMVYLGIRDESYISPGAMIINVGFLLMVAGVYLKDVFRWVNSFVQGI